MQRQRACSCEVEDHETKEGNNNCIEAKGVALEIYTREDDTTKSKEKVYYHQNKDITTYY